MNPPEPGLSETAAAYCCELFSAGWEQIGEGVGGRVFHRGVDADVIKVSDGDDCYLAFVDHVIGNPATCLPKLVVVHRTKQWAVIHIELLVPLDPANAVAVDQWWNSVIDAWKTGGPMPSPAEWSAVADALRAVAIVNGCGFDMKEVNAMQRGSTVVFTDPLN